MEEERIFLTKEQAMDCLIIKDGQVHNFVPAPFGVIGADWNIEDVKQCLENAESIEIGGEQCRAMSHGIAVINKENLYFFEADNKKLDKYDNPELLEKGE